MSSTLHIPSWTPEEIASWIKGLDDDLQRYIPTFLTHRVTGERLLKLTKQELEDLNITKMGHQELILEAVDLLTLVHYRHPTETLQTVALNLNCKASNLANLLNQQLQSGHQPSSRQYCLPSTILLRVAETISAAKTLISWLDRPPFSTSHERDFQEFSKDILYYALEMTKAVQLHPDLTAALPEILAIAREFASNADNLIKQSTDPLVIQPTTIEEVQIKKKRPEEELGLFIKTSTIDGIHYITGTKDKSAASISRKVGSGDELLRVNEQTVVSWEHCKVIVALKADPKGVRLTLRKRPCNLGSPGQILRPVNASHNLRLTPTMMRKDSFPSMRSPIMKEELLMPMSPNDFLISKQRSNSDPETQSETHVAQVAHSDSEALVHEAERIKRQRRGTMWEGLQRKGSRNQTAEGRPRSLPINTEELEAEVALWKASPISSRPAFSPIAGSPVSPQTASGSSQASPLPNGNRTPGRSADPADGLESSSSVSGTTPTPATPDNGNGPDPSAEMTQSGDPPTFTLSTLQPEISKPGDEEDEGCRGDAKQDQKPTTESEKATPDPDPRGEINPSRPTENEVASDVGEAKNANNNVKAGTVTSDPRPPAEATPEPQVVTGNTAGILTTDLDDFVVIETGSAVPAVPASPLTPTKSVTFIERTQSSASSMTSDCNTTVKLRPKKRRRATYKVKRGVSCVDLGPGKCEGWLYKKSDTKQTFRSNWSEMWFVLKEFVLYYFKSKSDKKAKGVVCLPGYVISDAPDSKREFAFKAVHQGTKPIYFAGHRQQDKTNWMTKLGLAAIMYSDKNKVRQSVIFESQPQQDVGAIMDSMEGYHSESDDEDKDSASVQSGSLSPPFSGGETETGSESGSPRPGLKDRRSHTSPDLLSQAEESASEEEIRKSGSSFPVASPAKDTADDVDGRPSEGATAGAAAAAGAAVPTQDDALLEHYMSLMEDNGCVSGLERTWEARTSKRFNQRGAGLSRIQTILDKDPRKNKKALRRRMLQRTLKAKQEELRQIETLLSDTSLSSEDLRSWKDQHVVVLNHILSGGKQGSSSDSDVSDREPEAAGTTGDAGRREASGRGPVAPRSTQTPGEELGIAASGGEDLGAGEGEGVSWGSSPTMPASSEPGDSQRTQPVPGSSAKFRVSVGSDTSETSL